VKIIFIKGLLAGTSEGIGKVRQFADWQIYRFTDWQVDRFTDWRL